MAGAPGSPPKYTFAGYPNDCPPRDCGERCGTYYRLLTSANKNDPEHHRTYHELRKGHDPDSCAARALTIVLTEQQARGYQASLGPMYRFMGRYELNGGHGVVRVGNRQTGHCSWWVPDGVSPSAYCSGISEIP